MLEYGMLCVLFSFFICLFDGYSFNVGFGCAIICVFGGVVVVRFCLLVVFGCFCVFDFDCGFSDVCVFVWID